MCDEKAKVSETMFFLINNKILTSQMKQNTSKQWCRFMFMNDWHIIQDLQNFFTVI